MNKSLFFNKEIREIEDYCFNELELEPIDLMERAGQALFRIIKEKYPKNKKLLIVTGKGNNAGDGFVLGRLAIDRGFEVKFLSLYKNHSKLAQKNFERLVNADFVQLSDLAKIDKKYLVIDAILGIGFEGELRDSESDVVKEINKLENIKIAVDVPTGLDSNNGLSGNICFKADLTISFLANKFGLYINAAKDYVGEVIVDDLAIDLARFKSSIKLLEFNDVKDLLKKRDEFSNKGSFGHLLLVAGFDNAPGAAILSGIASYRIGVGKVTIVTQKKNFPEIMKAIPEALLFDVDDLSKLDLTKDYTAIAIGPGLGQGDLAREALEKVLAAKLPKIIDADALNILADLEYGKVKNSIITPHPKEASRLLKIEVGNILKDPSFAVQKLVENFSDISLLKTNANLIADDKNIYLSHNGNAILAKAGTGDVLTGIIAGLVACNYNIFEATKLGSAIHGRLADLALKDYNKDSLLASELLNYLKKLKN